LGGGKLVLKIPVKVKQLDLRELGLKIHWLTLLVTKVSVKKAVLNTWK